MRAVRAKSDSDQTRPFYEAHDIERMCIEELKNLDLLPTEPSPIRIERFIERRFGISPSYENLSRGLLGFTMFGPYGPTSITISRDLDEDRSLSSQRRVRTTLAHETGHGLLHSHLFDNPSLRMQEVFGHEHANPKSVPCRGVVDGDSSEAGRYSGEWWEVQANMAMGSLLLPENLFRRAANPFLEEAGLLGNGRPRIAEGEEIEFVRTASELFDVNPIVVRYRIKQIFGGSAS